MYNYSVSHAEEQAKWRAANRERARELVRETAARWNALHPGENYFAVHRDQAQAERYKRQYSLNKRQKRLNDPLPSRAYDRDIRAPWNGIPERAIHATFAAEHPGSVCFDEARPDFYDPKLGFVEIKRALPVKIYSWRAESEFFPGLFFLYTSKQTRSVDEQIGRMPRPLTVIVYDGLTGDELQRRLFP